MCSRSSLGVGKYFGIRAALAARGYTEAQHEIAWIHLKQLAVFPAASTPTLDKPVRDAILAIDAWYAEHLATRRTLATPVLP